MRHRRNLEDDIFPGAELLSRALPPVASRAPEAIDVVSPAAPGWDGAQGSESAEDARIREQEEIARAIVATRFKWCDPASIPPRPWLYGRHLIRGFASTLIAPGGLGKTSLGVVDALALCSGKTLIGDQPHAPSKVWLVNLEDPRDEMLRRLVAAAMHYGIDPAVLEDRLHLDVGRERPIVTAEATRSGAVIIRPVVDALEREIKANGIDALIVDPFVSSHRVPENDNGAIDLVAKEWSALAGRTNCAVELVHHVRKLRGEDATAEDARGGSALLAAVRAARVINGLSAEEAKSYGIPERDRRRYFRVDDGKSNLAPPAEAKWRQMVSVSLGNATADRPDDFVGVVAAWTPPNPLDGINVDDLAKVQDAIDGKGLRQNSQARDWVGHVVGETLGISVSTPEGKAKVSGLIKIWVANDALRIVHVTDEKGKQRPTVEVGIRSF
jgi:hypothetical protein